MSENETVIIVNDEDRADGFFTFSTTIKSHYERIKKLGEFPTKIDTYRGKPRSWIVRVPIAYISRSFSIRKPSRTKGVSRDTSHLRRTK